MGKLAAPKRKRAAKHGPPGGGGTQAPPTQQHAPRRSASAAVGVLQPKLRVNEPDDQYEREADRMADRVMSMPEPRARSGAPAGRETEELEQAPVQRQAAEEEPEEAQTASLQPREDEGEEEAQTFSLQRQETDPEAEREETAQTAALQRQDEEVEEEEPEQAQASPLQRRTDEEEDEARMQQRAKRPHRPHITPQFEAGLKLLRHGGGQPLPEPLRAYLEPRFGRGLADVRAHVGPEAAALAREANARAFTVGRHIVFGAGEYRPGVEQGRRLIAHELTHVFQQRGGLHSVQREVGPDRASDVQRPEPPDLEELRAAFDLGPMAAPPSVLSIALDLLRGALGNQTDAERLKPLTTTEDGAVVRRIESGSYTLELTARDNGAGMDRSWTLTHCDKRQTFVSRSGSAAQQGPGASQGADVETVSLTAPPAAQYPDETMAGRLESDRPGVEAPPDKPPPLLPEAVPAGAIPGAETKAPPYRAPAMDGAALAPEVESGTGPAVEPLPPTTAGPAEVPGTPAEAGATEAGVAGPTVTETPAAEGGEPVEEEVHAPHSPEEDPDFQETVAKVGRTRKAQAAHAPTSDKQTETRDAGLLPEEQQHDVNDRNAHFDEIGKTAEESKKKQFTPEEFKKMLAESIAKIPLPRSEDDAKKFKRDKPLEAAKQSIRGQVQEQNQNIVGPLANEVGVEQPPNSQRPVTKPGDLVEEQAGKRPAPISRTAAAPKPRLDSEISFEKESASLDQLMVENQMTEEQLAVSNEPQFVQALDSKKQAQQKAAEAPGVYREGEQTVLEGARGQAGHAGAKGFGAMFGTREGAFTTVFSKQSSTAKADKDEQARIQEQLAGIYSRTKSDVDGTLESLTKAVESIFSVQVGLAKSTFESRVEDQLDEIYGWTVIDDWLFGEDTEAIDAVFQREKERFLKTMDTVIDQLAQLIAAFLNAAIQRIETGRQEAKTFFDGLTKEQQRLSQEAYNVFKLQFETLEDSVREKEQELADTLAESYRSNVDSLQESFDKIKEDVSRGWIGGAIDFVKGVAEVIGKLSDLLFSVLSRVANVVLDILAHPIRFIENLAAGIGAGFDLFIKKIGEYLVAGFFEWLRGAAGPAIKLPEKFDAAGLFDLVMQVLGFTRDNFRRIAVKVWGKAAVELLEAGAAAAEKGLEIFQIVREKGLLGLWEFIQASLSSLVEELIQKVKETVLFATIEKALGFVASLFTPVGAFIKAAQTIYRGIRFLMDNINRIAEIVDAFLSSVELAVAGKTDVIAQKIVTALRGFIVVGIDFLAKLFGLGDLAAKIRKILKAITAPFERAVEAVLKGLKSLVKGVMRKLGIGAKGQKKTRAQKRREKEKRKTKKIEKKGQRPLSHSEVVTQVFSAMSKPTKAKTSAAALAEKQQQAQSLIKTYQPQLKKGRLRIAITDPSVKQVEEDAAVDFDVSASPGKPGEAPVALEIPDEKVVQERFAHARSLKKFTGEKGFALDDWAATFPKLSRATHQTDLRYGVKNKLLTKADDATYHFKTGVSLEDIAERGALEIQNEARAHPPFKKGRFGVPLIQAFLAGRKIPGIPPETFEERTTVEAAAGRAEKAGAITKVGKTDTWALPDMPAVRRLPEGWGGATDVRPRFYEREAGFATLADDFAERVIAKEVTKRIAKLILDPTNLKPWQELVDCELARKDEKFKPAAAKLGFYEARNRYDVDHIKPLAQHWNADGNDTDQATRVKATRGAPGERGLQLLELSINRSKGSEGVEYDLFVKPNFTSPRGTMYTPDGDEFYQEFELSG